MSRTRASRRGTLLAAGIPLLALTVWLAVSLPSASARTDPQDARATWSYLQAEDRLFRVFLADSHREVLSGEEFVDRLVGECPGAAALPQSTDEPTVRLERKESGELFKETAEADLVALLGPDLSTYRIAATALAGLRWSSRRLTALVHRTAGEATLTSSLRPPDVCSQLKEWAAGGYTTLPAATSRFLTEFAAAKEGGDEESVEAMLASYEGPRGQALRRRLVRLRERTARLLGTALGSALVKAQTRLGFVPVSQTGPAIALQPPPSVVESGGKRLSEFDLGRAVAAQSGCLACHRIGEAGNPGPGPDLTHVGSQLTGTQIARALIAPKAPMPSFGNLPRKKFEALVEFLSVLR